MSNIDPDRVVDRLLELQAGIRSVLMRARQQSGLERIARTSHADTIYAIDAAVEPLLVEYCAEWGRETPLVLISEGLEDEHGREGPRAFPEGTPAERCELRVIIDPIDGTRGLMYDKRAAWCLAAAAPNRGEGTRLSDCFASAMTELPTSKMGAGDILWAIRGRGAHGLRVDLRNGAARALALTPSDAGDLAHGFAMVSHLFPQTKALAGELTEYILANFDGPGRPGRDATPADVFDDSYISTGGQFYELIVGHDRFNADLRPQFFALLNRPVELCCHPYDCAGLLVAEEAGVVITDPGGGRLDCPLDTQTAVGWLGYGNGVLRGRIEPLVREFFGGRQRC